MAKDIFSTLKKIIRFFFPILVFGIGLFAILKGAHAASYLGPEWDQFLQGVPGFKEASQKTGETLATDFIRNAIRIVRNLVGAVAIIMGLLYAIMLVFARGKEETITKQKMNFLYMLIGFVVLIIAENVANIFNPATAEKEALIDFGRASDQLRDIMSYIKWLVGSVMVLMMTISGIRMVTSGHDEETMTKQKRNITWSLIGALVILLANDLVGAVYVMNEKTGVAEGAATPSSAIKSIASVARLLLVFLGPVAIIFTIMRATCI